MIDRGKEKGIRWTEPTNGWMDNGWVGMDAWAELDRNQRKKQTKGVRRAMNQYAYWNRIVQGGYNNSLLCQP
jgi:hypothetical protein